jgi:hypothetical protein
VKVSGGFIAAGCVAAALAYAVVLAVLKWVPRYDCLTLPLVLFGIFHALDRVSVRERTVALHLVTQIFVAAFLVHLWTLGYEGRNAVFGGILPWSDSHDFYDDALRLVHGHRFNEVSSKRPLFTAALAALLRISGGDLRFALVVCAVFGALATALAALEVWKTHGYKSALLVFAILLFFERRWTGFVQTEHLGLPMGAVGFALFWRASRRPPGEARALALSGLFAMTVGLMARAGAFFVLPALVIWAARRLVPPEAKARLRFSALAAMVIGLGVASHEAVLLATGQGVTFSDYPAIAYGLMHGQDYTFLAEAHPELAALPVEERVSAASRVLFGEALADPLALVRGFARSGAGLFTSPYGMFSYVWTNPDDHVLEAGLQAASHRPFSQVVHWRRTLGTLSLLNGLAMGALGVAFVAAWVGSSAVLLRRRAAGPDRDPVRSLLAHASVGVVLSAPFTPPWITSGQQVQTVTLAFVAALPAVVLLGRAVVAPVRRTAGPSPRDVLRFAPPSFVVALVALIAWLRASPEPVPPCTGSGHVVRVFPGIRAVVSSSRSLAFAEKARADLEASMRFLVKHNASLTRSLAPFLRTRTVYVSGFDACTLRAKILVDQDARLGFSRAWRRIDAEVLEAAAVLRVTGVDQTPVEP